MKRYLVLEDGTVFEGEAFGADKEVTAEIVFTTAMTGYVETLTDPSYKGQAVLQTFPLMGNYGVMSSDKEGDIINVSAYIVREVCDSPSNFRCEGDLHTFLKSAGIPGLKGIDTRSLTKRLRDKGTMNGMICDDPSHADLEKIRSYVIKDPVSEVSVTAPKLYEPEGETLFDVAVMDYGIKMNIVRQLLERGCRVHLLPHDTPASAIREMAPDGLFLSNGPGDPTDNVGAINTLKELRADNIPTMGICLGHQLLALAHGFETHKLKYGHRGANHPVREEDTGKIYITSQNHGYAVTGSSVDPAVAETLFVNVNDQTNEGLIYRNEPAFSVQFHPEAAGGPQDSRELFDRFIGMMERK